MSRALTMTLSMVADAAAGAEDPWWIIGSAAVALHGAELADVRDVDLLMSVTDARGMLRRLGVTVEAGKPSEKFRSEVLGVWRASPLPVDAMGGFSLATPAGWSAVRPASRQAVKVEGRDLFVPSAAELREILAAFGREKDLVRARLLER